jgi:hypothetical protein
MAIRWAIRNGIEPDRTFSNGPTKSLHVVLSENYNDKYERTVLGQYVHVGVRQYLGRVTDVFAGKPGIETWNDDFPASIVYRLEEVAFEQGKPLGSVVARVWTDAVRELRQADIDDLRIGEKQAAAYYPTTPEMRAELKDLKRLSDSGLYGGNVNDRVCRKMIEIVRRPTWSPG